MSMFAFVARRLVQGAIVIVAAASLVFVLARLSGDPALLIAPPGASAEQVREISQSLGLDDPLYVQYLHFLHDVATGNLGESFIQRKPVSDIVTQAAPFTLTLAISAFIFASVIGVSLGTIAALNVDSWIDQLATVVGLLGQSVPSFWLGMLLIMLFAVKLGVLPPFGPGGPDHVILPMVTLGAYPLSAVTRLTRSATLDVLRADHTVFERSKGVSEITFLRHVLRNASLPVITLSGIQLGGLISATIIVETLFAWPGLGQLVVQSVAQRDYSIVQGVVLVDTTIFVILNLLVDLSYGVLDPRVRRQAPTGVSG
jgi:peptide/nickel transport system permease protein